VDIASDWQMMRLAQLCGVDERRERKHLANSSSERRSATRPDCVFSRRDCLFTVIPIASIPKYKNIQYHITSESIICHLGC
jgi:hypothetical protein